MSDEDYEMLDELLGRLSLVLKQRYCIIPNHIQDLIYIGTYDHDGFPTGSGTGLDVKDAVEKIRSINSKTRQP